MKNTTLYWTHSLLVEMGERNLGRSFLNIPQGDDSDLFLIWFVDLGTLRLSLLRCGIATQVKRIDSYFLRGKACIGCFGPGCVCLQVSAQARD